jgi:RNA polymerase sigma factor (sigma-70 family)
MLTDPGGVVRRLRPLVAPAGADRRTDQELLRRYAEDADEAAFATLVRRHGPAVWGVCRRALGATPDAEDAFQAAFIVLARRAAALGSHESVGAWLHLVARRLAVRARAAAARRARREPPPPRPAPPGPVEELGWREVGAILDEELARLPDGCRAAVVLCCLEGRARDEAAAELGWPLGTLKARLERGRDLLRRRLLRRGLTLPAALAAAGLARAAVSVGLLVRATRAAAPGAGHFPHAAELAGELLRMMARTPLRRATAALAAATALAVGVGAALALQPPAFPPDEPAGKAAAPNPGNDRVADTAQGRLEFIGLTRMTAKEALAKATGKAPDGKLVFCAPCLKEAGFAEVSVAVFVEQGPGGKPYYVVAVVEPDRAGRVRYRAVPPATDAAPLPEWKDGLAAAADPMLFQAAIFTYGHALDDKHEKAAGVMKNFGQDPERVKAVWAFLKARSGPADRDRAVWALAHHGDPAHRTLAAAVLLNFADSELAWWSLADAQRDPHGLVSSTAEQALRVLAKHRPRAVDWRPASPALRHLLGGTNLFAFLPTLDLLAATNADRGWSRISWPTATWCGRTCGPSTPRAATGWCLWSGTPAGRTSRTRPPASPGSTGSGRPPCHGKTDAPGPRRPVPGTGPRRTGWPTTRPGAATSPPDREPPCVPSPSPSSSSPWRASPPGPTRPPRNSSPGTSARSRPSGPTATPPRSSTAGRPTGSPC